MSLRLSTPERGITPLTLRISEVVNATGIGRSTLYRAMGDGELEYLKIGRSRLIRYSALTAYLDKQGK
jgi:excisionase family DNA binding protein